MADFKYKCIKKCFTLFQMVKGICACTIEADAQNVVNSRGRASVTREGKYTVIYEQLVELY